MAWHATAYAIPSLVSALASVLLAGYVWRYRDEALARAFLVLLVAIVAWSLVYTIQLSGTTLAEQLFWQRLGLSIGATLPTIWIVFATVYAGDEHRLTPAILALLLVDPVAFAMLAWTNGATGLLWTSASLAPGPGLDLAFTPVYLVHITYAYLLVLAGIGIMVAVYVRSSAIYRRQAGLLIFGAVVPLAANLAFTLGVSPVPGLDLTTSTFTVTGVVFALGLFRFDLLDLTPVAHRRVLDEFGSGVVVVDDRGRVVHANDTARTVLPDLAMGASITELLSVETIAAVDDTVSAVDAEAGRRFYEFAVSSLSDFRDRPVGHVVALQDVTTAYEYEQRLEVANRLLRHNLRNDMNKIIGWASIASDDADGEVLEALERIELVAEDVSALSRKATRIERTLGIRRRDLVTEDLVDVLESVVEELRAVWPEATVSMASPGTATVRAPGDGLLATALRNLVENGIAHNDRPRPTVHVTVEVEDDARVAVSVRDDGPGLPALERRALLVEKESPLEHGSGLGLWLVRWIAHAAGGTLAFEENEPRGSVLTITFPAAGVEPRAERS